MTPQSNDNSESDSSKLDRLELALKASNEGIWDWVVDNPRIYYTRRILEFLECGDSRAPNLFLPPHDHIHPDDVEQFKAALEDSFSTGGPDRLSIDSRVRTGSGNWIWLRIRGSIIRDREGKPVRIAGSMIDISRRKTAEGLLREERHLLKTLIEHVPLQIYFKDTESRFVIVNRNAVERMGLKTTEEMIGKHDRDFFSEEHSMPAYEDEKRIMETHTPMCDVLEHETWPDRAESWVITSKFPWLDEKGTLKGTFGVSNDVTKLVLAQKESRELADQLAEKNKIYEEELQLAREIQAALTHQSDISTLDFELKAEYIPITGLAGDFYEIIPIDEQRVGILICDVMGHGVRSALIVAMLRGLLEKQRAQAISPGAFLGGLNDGLAAILERAGTTMFATAFYCVVDQVSGTFQYACAGHPGPFLAKKSGEFSQIGSTRGEKGPGLGLMENANYPTLSIPLDQLHQLILYTDGLIETANRQQEEFGTERLLDVLTKTIKHPLEDVLKTTLNKVLKFSHNGQFEDDVCLLGIRF